MIFLYFGLIALFAAGCKLRNVAVASTWLNRDTTTAINGFFILIVLVNHANQYISGTGFAYTSWMDASYRHVASYVGQLIVAMFLFNSGFGVMESIKHKKDEYVRNMPKRRILPVLANFDIAVLVFCVLNLLLGISMNVRQFLLSLVCWDDVGNSNWYIFAILYCYVAVYVAFRLAKSCDRGLMFALFGILAYALVMPFFKGGYWYDTIFAFATGLIVSNYKECIHAFANKYYWTCFVVLAVCFVIGKIVVGYLPLRRLDHNCVAVVFCLLFSLICMKVDFGNRMTAWCGKNLFPLYIYQRIPMVALAATTSLAANVPIAFVILSGLLTLPIVVMYKHFKISP